MASFDSYVSSFYIERPLDPEVAAEWQQAIPDAIKSIGEIEGEPRHRDFSRFTGPLRHPALLLIDKWELIRYQIELAKLGREPEENDLEQLRDEVMAALPASHEAELRRPATSAKVVRDKQFNDRRELVVGSVHSAILLKERWAARQAVEKHFGYQNVNRKEIWLPDHFIVKGVRIAFAKNKAERELANWLLHNIKRNSLLGESYWLEQAVPTPIG